MATAQSAKVAPIKAFTAPITPKRSLLEMLTDRVVGQNAALQEIASTIKVYQAGLSAPDRPAGVFLLLGPTGTGKTKTVEALAEVLHGNAKYVIKVDCGEFQEAHEVAKLLGAPPGYLGHKETSPIITQNKLSMVVSDKSSLSIVLFDEIEKAHPSVIRLLLGVLDKGTLRLGDNTQVDFTRSIIVMTSNIGSRQMLEATNGGIGFYKSEYVEKEEYTKIGNVAMAKLWPPEFRNRIDKIITYTPLKAEDYSNILNLELDILRKRIFTSYSDLSYMKVTPEARIFLLSKSISAEYGARELKRTLYNNIIVPLAELVSQRDPVSDYGDTVLVTLQGDVITPSFGYGE